MLDKEMEFIGKGTRSEMLKRERSIVQVHGGPPNRERWSSTRRVN